MSTWANSRAVRLSKSSTVLGKVDGVMESVVVALSGADVEAVSLQITIPIQARTNINPKGMSHRVREEVNMTGIVDTGSIAPWGRLGLGNGLNFCGLMRPMVVRQAMPYQKRGKGDPASRQIL